MKKIILLAIALLILIIACNPEVPKMEGTIPSAVSDENSVPQTNTASRNENIGHSVLEKVKIKSFAFQPEEVRIKVGDSVEWEQFDNVPHTVTLVSGPEEFDSGLMRKGDKWVHTFDKPGVYEYHCTPHTNMKGKVIVE